MADVPSKWYNDGSVVRKFLQALIEAEFIENIEEVTSFVERPRDYNAAHEAWVDAGAPEDESEDGWDAFVDAIDNDDDDDEEDDGDDD